MQKKNGLIASEINNNKGNKAHVANKFMHVFWVVRASA